MLDDKPRQIFFLRNKAFFTGWCLLLISFILYLLIANFEEPASEYRVISPSFFPFVLTTILAGLSLLLLREGWQKPSGAILSIDFKNPDTYRTLALLFILIIFSIFLTSLGFVIDAFLFMVAVQILLGERQVIRVLAMALAVSFGLYFMFAKLFYIPLPPIPWL